MTKKKTIITSLGLFAAAALIGVGGALALTAMPNEVNALDESEDGYTLIYTKEDLDTLFKDPQRNGKDIRLMADIDYAGGRYGASLSLSPEGTKGWHAAFAYVHQSLTRIVQLQNSNHELDLNTLKYDDFSLKTAFRDPDAKLPYGVSLFLDYEHRYGQDILYGPSQNGIYPELMRIKNMVIHHGQANLQADMEWQQTRGRLFFQAFLQYGILSYRHRSPDESFNGSGITAGGRLQKDWSFGRKKTKGTKASRSFESSQAFQLGSEFAYRQGTGVIDPMGTAALKADWLLGLGRYSVRVGLQARYRYFLSGSWREMAPWNRYLSRSGHSPHAFQLQLGAGLVF